MKDIIVQPYSDMPPIVIEYFNYLETIRNKASNTIIAYQKDLRIFFRYMLIYKGKIDNYENIEFKDIDISNISIEFIKSIKLSDFYAFLSYSEKVRHNTAKTRSREVTCLRSFFNYMKTKAKVIEDNPALELEIPKVGKREPLYLTVDECMQVLNSLDKKKKNYLRDYCILIIFLNCGLRLDELCNMKLSDINNETVRVIGKGNKERIIPLTNSCITAINEYITNREEEKIPKEFRDYVFISNRGLPINPRTVEILVKKHISNAGLGNKYTPHKLRHTAATMIYKYGDQDIKSLQQILGHSNIATTEIYTHIDDEDIKRNINSNPLANLK